MAKEKLVCKGTDSDVLYQHFKLFSRKITQLQMIWDQIERERETMTMTEAHQVPKESDPPTGITYGLRPSFSSLSFKTFVRA